MSRTFKIGVLAAAVMAIAPAAQAFEAGDFILRAGVVHAAPDDSSDVITAGGVALLGNDARVAVDSNTQLGLRATYMFNSNIGLGLLAATPFKHNITRAFNSPGMAWQGRSGKGSHVNHGVSIVQFAG